MERMTGMPDHETAYHICFNAITDALRLLNRLPPDKTVLELYTILTAAQCTAEEIYEISAEETVIHSKLTLLSGKPVSESERG